MGVVILKTYQKQQNELAFKEARIAIDLIYEEVVAQVGKPDDSKQTNSCARNFQEWGGGEITCDVGADFIYGVNGRTEATEIYKKIQSIVLSKDNTLLPDSPLSTSIKDELVIDTYYHSAYDSFKTNKGLKCIAKYVYDTPKDTYLPIPEGEIGFYVTIGCYGGAKAAYYPLDN